MTTMDASRSSPPVTLLTSASVGRRDMRRSHHHRPVAASGSSAPAISPIGSSSAYVNVGPGKMQVPVQVCMNSNRISFPNTTQLVTNKNTGNNGSFSSTIPTNSNTGSGVVSIANLNSGDSNTTLSVHGSTSTSTSTGAGRGNTIVSSSTSSSTTGTSNPNPTSNDAAMDGSSTVDSALLSALRDQRERFALLRLEQTLIDFMNDKTSGFMEVGGPFNSIVIRGASGGGANSDGESEPIVGAARMSSSGAAAMEQQGGRQTSFQRLCLHRLADRFNIVRETGVVSTNNNPALIRLVKVKNSRIPSALLINLDMSENTSVSVSNPSPQDRGDASDSPAGGVKLAVDRLASVHLKDASPGTNASADKTRRSKKKVMIMKRNSNKGSSGSLNNDGGNTDLNSSGSNFGANSSNKLKGKNMSDKEKAYAEARARIFNTSHPPSSAPAPLSAPAPAPALTNPPPPSPEGSDIDSSQHSESKNIICNNTVSNEDSDSAAPPQSQSSEITRSLSNSPPVESNELISDDGLACSNNNGNIPKAATGGAASKVTWRNRRQEESDPDFQRGRHPVMVAPIPIVSGTSGIGYHPPHYPPGSVIVTGPMVHSAINNSGVPQHHLNSCYHYGNAIDGQSMGYGTNTPNVYQHHNSTTNSQVRYHGKAANMTWQRQDTQQHSQGFYPNSSTNGRFRLSQQQQQPQPQMHYSYKQGEKSDNHGTSPGSSSSSQPTINSSASSVAMKSIANRHQGSSPWGRGSAIEKNGGDIIYSSEDFPALG